MLILVETAAGFGLFKLHNTKLLKLDADSISKHFSDLESTKINVSFSSFSKFNESKEALSEATCLIESKMGPLLEKFLKKTVVKKKLPDELLVCDKQLANDIKSKLNINVLYNPNTTELIRGLKDQIFDLVAGLSEKDCMTMALSLSHSLNRFKLKFSADKVDTMIIQAIGLLDDLDRELNNFGMRLKEWYGWHFPELAQVAGDNKVYAQICRRIGYRSDARNTDLSDLLPAEIEFEVKQSAEISMGTDITQDDLDTIFELADRVIELSDYRVSLAEYLKNRMTAIAPNLTHMVGELIGARLISHSGSLINLARHPSSTVQILGAEKALFRALKTKSNTPKYGLIYHATLVGQSSPNLKGKISRVLAAKLSLCVRVDALGDQTEPTIAVSNRRYVEKKLEEFSSDSMRKLSSITKPLIKRYEPKRLGSRSIGDGTNVVSTNLDLVGVKPHKRTLGEKNTKDDKGKKLKLMKAENNTE